LDVTPYARRVSDARTTADRGAEEPFAPTTENEPAAAGEGEQQDRSRLAGVAASIADAAAPVISGARRLIDERPGARVRRVRRMGHEGLANLWDRHPEAKRAAIRELGLQSVPVDQIAGTAVEGPPQRGGDFLPLPDRRSDDWRARWQRILRAIDSLATLPPVELIKFGDEYWVVDGHNRVAAALYTGQTDVDGIVQEFRLPGMPAQAPTLIASVLEGSLDLRDAGAGRFTRTVSRPANRLPIQVRSDARAEAPPDGEHRE
jgi:hypothetical protein